MEIERKFLIQTLPEHLENFHSHLIEQGYLCTDPVVRIRRQDDEFILTYKGKGFMTREEYNLPLTEEAYYHLREKADGNIISKKRYVIPLVNPSFKPDYPAPPDDYTLFIELDVFEAPFAPLIMAEVEFGSKESAEGFIPPDWFGEDVTFEREYHNSVMATMTFES